MTETNAPTIAAGAAKIEVLFAELGSENHRFVTDAVAQTLHGLATTLHKVAPVIDRLETDLSTAITRAENHGVHVEPVLVQLRDRLRASKWLHKDHKPSELFEIFVDGVEILAPEEAKGSLGVVKMPPLVEIGEPCVTSKNFAATLRTFKSLFDKDVQEVLDCLLVDLNRERRRALARLVRAAFVPLIASDCQDLFEKYVLYATLSQRPVHHRLELGFAKPHAWTDWLYRIEGQPMISRGHEYICQFRDDVLATVKRFQEEHGSQTVPYTVHSGLQERIEFLVLDYTRHTPVRMLDEAERTRIERAQASLVEEHGLCTHCAGELMEEFSNLKESLLLA